MTHADVLLEEEVVLEEATMLQTIECRDLYPKALQVQGRDSGASYGKSGRKARFSFFKMIFFK